MSSERVTQDKVVSIAYKLTLQDGSLVEETNAGNPLVYLHGHNNIISGLERELEGLIVGDKKTVVVEPGEAYGEYDSKAVETFKRGELPPEIEPEIGMMLTLEDDEGNMLMAQLSSVTSEDITLDFNHPMAGKQLHFETTVVELREATAEELDHGHVHGQKGHDH
jgi:FKBP-type peptidyl-prolyl cis-trans isomerase SlyD